MVDFGRGRTPRCGLLNDYDTALDWFSLRKLFQESSGYPLGRQSRQERWLDSERPIVTASIELMPDAVRPITLRAKERRPTESICLISLLPIERPCSRDTGAKNFDYLEYFNSGRAFVAEATVGRQLGDKEMSVPGGLCTGQLLTVTFCSRRSLLMESSG